MKSAKHNNQYKQKIFKNNQHTQYQNLHENPSM